LTNVRRKGGTLNEKGARMAASFFAAGIKEARIRPLVNYLLP